MIDQASRLTQWVIDRIRAEYPNDVALLVAVSGHSVDGDGHGECFDYFVPATERGNELAQTFIIDGIGHDLYPRDWERMRRTADLDDWATLCLGDARILYARTPGDEARFEALRDRLHANLRDPAFTYQKALAWLDVAMDLYRTLMFEQRLCQARMAVGLIHDYLSMGVAYLNGSYIQKLVGRVPELERMRQLPDRFIGLYLSVMDANDVDELRRLAHEIIASARAFFAAHRPKTKAPAPNADYKNLAGWYEELSLTLRRIRYHCREQNADGAFMDGCHLQNELNVVCSEFGLPEMDLLGCFDPADLAAFSERTSRVEREIVSQIEAHGATIRRYDSLEAFLRDA